MMALSLLPQPATRRRQEETGQVAPLSICVSLIRMFLHSFSIHLQQFHNRFHCSMELELQNRLLTAVRSGNLKDLNACVESVRGQLDEGGEIEESTLENLIPDSKKGDYKEEQQSRSDKRSAHRILIHKRILILFCANAYLLNHSLKHPLLSL